VKVLDGKAYARLRSIGNEALALSTVLSMNQSLTVLDLSGSNVGNDGMNVIANSIKKHATITRVYFNDMQLIGIVEQLDTLIRYNTVLEELHLAKNKLGDEGTKALIRSCSPVDCFERY
jgi:Ran GTPase-activating protein (RanGAP) involved in mRNA processing and transport